MLADELDYVLGVDTHRDIGVQPPPEAQATTRSSRRQIRRMFTAPARDGPATRVPSGTAGDRGSTQPPFPG